jgi:hypothetical protein
MVFTREGKPHGAGSRPNPLNSLLSMVNANMPLGTNYDDHETVTIEQSISHEGTIKTHRRGGSNHGQAQEGREKGARGGDTEAD